MVVNPPHKAAARLDEWRAPDERHLPAHHQPALLIELARDRGIPDHRLLRHTGLFPADILTGKAMISDQQFRRLVGNVQQQGPAQELALLWGRQLLPGHYGALSPLLQHSPNLEQALQGIHEHRHHLCPLLVPRWWRNDPWAYLFWINAGAGRVAPFLSLAMMAAIYGLARHRSGHPPEWHFFFSQGTPANTAVHEVNLGQRLHFKAGIDLLILPVEDLTSAWTDSSRTLFSVASHQLAESQATTPAPATLPEVVYHLLMRHAETPLDLSATAQAMGMTPSSLKRRLRAWDTHFQALQDEVRFHYSLYLSQILGLGTDAIAERLSNGDKANFRRSFRRWTGLTPAHFQTQLLP